MAKDIVMIVGCKGGVGKTTIAKAVVDAALERGDNVLVIDADTANPGLYKAYRDHKPDRGNRVVVETFNLADPEGWSALVTLADELPNYFVVIDTPAGSHDSFRRYAETLHGSLGELEREWRSYFVTNGQRDSTELLRDYLGLVPKMHVVHAICNGFFGEVRAFRRYHESKTHDELEARGGLSITFPSLAGHVVSEVDWNRLTYADAMRAFPLGNRAQLGAWRKEAHQVLNALHPAA